MTESRPHVTVCVCTLQRPAMLERLLRNLQRQRTEDKFTYSVVVCDNDAARSAEGVVQRSADGSAIEIRYTSEPRRNIALARNRALALAQGEFIALIDDDEFPQDDWLLAMLEACETYRAAGVLGPVRPHFEAPPPDWILKGRFCERPEHPTGRIMEWEESRTGNLLFRRTILDGIFEPFSPAFGSGGEDKDFFMRMVERGHVFRWCNEGVTYETVPPDRWTRRYMLKRAMLRGKNILKHPVGRMELLVKSVVAVPAYTLILPVSLVLGQHVFMKYCIKFCDHLGRVLAVCGLNPVRER